MVESNRGKEKVSSCFLAKNWNPLFADNRKPKRELVPYVQWKREVNAPGDHLDHFFLTHPEDLGPACGFDEVKLFCEGICLETLKSGVGDAGTRRGAILDDKSCIGSTGGRCATACNAPLTATELYVQLNKPVCSKPCLYICAKFKADRNLN
jgi:hypothetical protein